MKFASSFEMDVKYTPNLGSNKLLCAQRPGAHEVGGGEANAREYANEASNRSCIVLGVKYNQETVTSLYSCTHSDKVLFGQGSTL